MFPRSPVHVLIFPVTTASTLVRHRCFVRCVKIISALSGFGECGEGGVRRSARVTYSLQRLSHTSGLLKALVYPARKYSKMTDKTPPCDMETSRLTPNPVSCKPPTYTHSTPCPRPCTGTSVCTGCGKGGATTLPRKGVRVCEVTPGTKFPVSRL